MQGYIIIFGSIFLFILIYIGIPAILIFTTYMMFQKRKKLNQATAQNQLNQLNNPDSPNNVDHLNNVDKLDNPNHVENLDNVDNPDHLNTPKLHMHQYKVKP
ncbi:hypothetical protein HUB98_02085 [Paenibacillus barcinonensis]|uniref:Uncharacterized protein n=1 Tax=Paenibacillus barcinonensis TaxID=198119 RepID=A0A2V4UYU1_PAEBA|nr:hypothetical protein [Paenibacillus barcinonensis]PYE45397.1 hypothetical protein DFQ00_12015 [Paenibacillus barcinonensis]QKS55216.1 hypothetical protein HUB98_02085 [Paenibacillus barcinonensis]